MDNKKSNRTHINITDWETMYRDDIERIHKDVLFFLKTRTIKSMHISRVHINEIDLYDQLVEHLYETSNNTKKHYCR